MARFDVYKNPDGFGYLLNIQARLLEQYSTRVVVPLLPLEQAPKPAATLNPTFQLGGDTLVMLTHLLSSIPTTALGSPVTSLEDRHTEIVNALDFLFQGF